jgi:hypothetical protein
LFKGISSCKTKFKNIGRFLFFGKVSKKRSSFSKFKIKFKVKKHKKENNWLRKMKNGEFLKSTKL